MVFGARNADDIYIGARQPLGDVKISLHKSGIWRLAHTKEAAERLNLGVADRLLRRWNPPAPVALGWTHSATIEIPTLAFQRPWIEKKPKDGPV